MRKTFGKYAAIVSSAGLAAALAIPGTASADNLELGLGGQYTLGDPLAESNQFSAIELRGWSDRRLGFGVFGYYGNLEADVDDVSVDDDVIRAGARGMYAPIVRNNTQFYVGAEASYEEWGDIDGWSAMPLVGVEYRPSTVRELGFHMDVGYRYTDLENDDLEIEQHGLSSQVGATYYF
ncbi:MAG: hypothetical protein JJU06_03760 [Ectothiorhodospiraceae bacterium]|nr:hypothetical protein [Ectothiorhodospiraceae bacterium]MCH8505556.1 hypothetical protein [Ectothiorhodospiraceae bacterium]